MSFCEGLSGGQSTSQGKGKSGLGEGFFDDIGGLPTLRRVHRQLYDKLFVHPWLGQFFVQSKRELVENQQTDFWAGLMGGPKLYGGRSPRSAHSHLFLPAEVFRVRHQILEETLIEAGIPEGHREKWLAMDSSFERAIVKTSPDECRGRYPWEDVIVAEKPADYDDEPVLLKKTGT